MGLLLILSAWGSLCVDASSSSSSSSSSVGMFRASYLDWLEPVEGRVFFSSVGLLLILWAWGSLFVDASADVIFSALYSNRLDPLLLLSLLWAWGLMSCLESKTQNAWNYLFFFFYGSLC